MLATCVIIFHNRYTSLFMENKNPIKIPLGSVRRIRLEVMDIFETRISKNITNLPGNKNLTFLIMNLNLNLITLPRKFLEYSVMQ